MVQYGLMVTKPGFGASVFDAYFAKSSSLESSTRLVGQSTHLKNMKKTGKSFLNEVKNQKNETSTHNPSNHGILDYTMRHGEYLL